MLMMVLRFCGINRSKPLMITLVAVGIVMLGITTSPGILPIYYKTVDFEIVDGSAKLIREYSVIICENDIQAADLIGQCRRSGINVPQDISVCGYISGPEFHHFYRITSVEYNPRGLGEYALSLAMRVISGEQDLPQSELLPVSFFEGETLEDLRI